MAENNSGNNSADDLLWAVIGGIILIALIWYLLRTEISIAVLFLSDYKLRLVELIVSPGPDHRLFHIRNWINNVPPDQVTFSSLMGLMKAAGKYYMIPVSLILFYWAYRLYKLPTYSRRFNSKGLVQSERSLWPEINVAMLHDILSDDPKKGKWATSRSPVEFIEEFKLLDRNKNLNRERTTKLLSKQLGKPYNGPNSLSRYEKALAGCFAAGIMDNKPAAESALDDMNISYDTKDVNLNSGMALFQRYFNEPEVQGVVKRHFYCHTVMYGLIEHCRIRSGVMPSALFLWMKPLARQRWYVLNNAGRKVAWADVCGIFNHYQAEVVHKGPIKKPFVVGAVNGLETISRTRVFEN